jgi:hypothetical protein
VVPLVKLVPEVLLLVNVPPLQLSVNVGAVQLTTASQDEAFAFTVMFAGQPVITGAVLSTTVTVKEHVEIFPTASVAV